LDIYREIEAAFLKWNTPEKVYIDFTGGTKAMSASAALAGAMIDVQLVYVGSDEYLVDFRKPAFCAGHRPLVRFPAAGRWL